ncbi:hypothetical protein ACX80U_09620 [Arthrobacter sp. TmT3-37]
MDVDTRRLTGTTGILTQPVQDLDDFTGNPGKYLLDLYADEDGAAKAWTRAGESHHFRYNDGVITLAWDGIPLLGVPNWDDICTLWTYLVNVIEDYLATGRGESFFPDQPTPIVLERIHGGALITIGDTKVRVDPSIFCRELLNEAERFWRWVDRHAVPIHGNQELSRINQVRL